MDWFLYDIGLRHERVKVYINFRTGSDSFLFIKVEFYSAPSVLLISLQFWLRTKILLLQLEISEKIQSLKY